MERRPLHKIMQPGSFLLQRQEGATSPVLNSYGYKSIRDEQARLAHENQGDRGVRSIMDTNESIFFWRKGWKVIHKRAHRVLQGRPKSAGKTSKKEGHLRHSGSRVKRQSELTRYEAWISSLTASLTATEHLDSQ